jgi:succinate dehydrogenase / fumarate reductase flavoprotein subunit
VKKYEHWEFLSAELDGNRVCCGICAMDLRTMEIHTSLRTPSSSRRAARCHLGKSTNSVVCAARRSRRTSARHYYANGRFIQVHPTSIPGEDKLRLMSNRRAAKVAAFGFPKQG